MRLLLILALLSMPCLAQASATYRCKNGVISEDTTSSGEVVQKCGKPDRVVQLVNDYGAGVAERWEYYVGNKTVMVTIRAGRVREIQEA